MKKRVRPYPHYKFPDEIEIRYKKLSESECSWYGIKLGSYEIFCANYGWFPTEAVMGVINRQYADTNNIGANISGNLGTRGMAVMDIKKAVNLLNSAGYLNISESN